MKRVDELLQNYREEMMETLQSWVKIPSVKGDPAPGAPFGVENRKALDLAMADCEKMGMKTLIVDGYAGHADLGEGDDYEALAILAHLDVVPAGDGWSRDPFGASGSMEKCMAAAPAMTRALPLPRCMPCVP